VGRRLPEDPHKRRLAIFKRIYQHMPHWRECIIAGTMGDILTIPETGEEVYFHDLLVGLDSLPPRQREAFELICCQGYTETAAAKIMLPNSRFSTTAQQHLNAALERMVAAYDEAQSGIWRIFHRWRLVMSVHPFIERRVREGLMQARNDIDAEIDKHKAEIDKLKAALGQVDQMLKGQLPGKPEPRQSRAKEPAVVDLDAAGSQK